jgi:hypothetical protein
LVIGQIHPVHRLRNLVFKTCRTFQLKWGGAHPTGRQLQLLFHCQFFQFVNTDFLLNGYHHTNCQCICEQARNKNLASRWTFHNNSKLNETLSLWSRSSSK